MRVSSPQDAYSAPRPVAAETITQFPSLPGRGEFGLDHYSYIAGLRMRVGATRTMRPFEGETGTAFRTRVEELAQQLLLCGTLSMDEEIRGGVVVQAILRLQIAPETAPILDDARAAGGRPSGPRGRRGGSS